MIDGHARLLVKTDVAALGRKDKILEVSATEATLSESWASLHALVKSCKIAQSDLVRIYGRLSSRLVLLLTKKQKDGMDKTTYRDIAQIKAAFMSEVLKASGEACADAHPEKTEVVISPKAAALTLDDMSDPCKIARRNGYRMWRASSTMRNLILQELCCD